MILRTFYKLWLIPAFFLFSCRNGINDARQSDAFVQQVKQLEETRSSAANTDSLLKSWMALSQKPLLQRDTVLSAQVNYNIGRLYAIAGSDSAETYIVKALELIEATEGNLELKARIYNGMGNIRSSDTRSIRPTIIITRQRLSYWPTAL